MDKSGFAYLIVFAAILAAGALFGGIFGWFLFVVGVFLCAFTVFFFRDPKRTVPDDPMAIVSPADGVIIAIDDMRCLHIDGGSRIVIFMSPANVHVNRVPFAGEIEYLEHFPGKFLKAYLPETSIENERVDMLIKTAYGKICVKQIAGIIARRIVNRAKLRSVVQKGEKFGVIHFGSRVEVFLPPNSEILVREQQKTSAGETILARWL